MVALAWWLSYKVMANSFEPVQIQGLTFSGPSADWLMRVLAEPGEPWSFGLGLMPGVFLGSFIGAMVGGDLKLEGFNGAYTMPRYIIGAMLMGFGSMLAGGCAVGAGMTGGAIFAVTAWVTLGGMWVGGGTGRPPAGPARQNRARGAHLACRGGILYRTLTPPVAG